MEEKKNIPEIRFKGFEGEWEEKKIGKLGDIVTGSTPSTLEPLYYSNDGIPWVTPTDITEHITHITAKYLSVKGMLVSRLVPKNTILVTCIASIGKNTMLGTLGSFNQQINGLVPDENNYNAYFLYTESSIWSDKMKRSAASGTMQIVNKTEFSELKTFIPTLKEQSQIGSFFQNLDKQITLEQQKYDKLVTLKKAMLEKMFPKEGEDVPEIRFKGFTSEWEEVRLGDLGDFKSNGVDKKSNTNEIPVYLLNYMDVYNRRKINALNCHTLMPVTAKSSQVVDNNILKNDIFFTPSSETPDDIGKVMVIEESLPNTVYSYHLVRYRPKENCFATFFPNYGFSCNFVRKQMILAAQGVQRFVINRGSFEELRVMLPLIKEQTKIGSYFQNLDKLISLQQKKMDKLKNIKKACLEKMFV